ncbi:hypothetical protein [Gluconobacter morbifer]|uniref:Lipoyl-binding domain-containing protein n=1 Tax=Gluconobacter morbifer G707 TaxID=1088869 RepID=G6XM14_9PROT|nr:hypothetical protein [Gluconobacter morbifer]EHH67419.1 hypothetical protein GMO_24140 [Gluconobacter morbifer G707]
MTFLEDLLNDLPKLVDTMRHHDVHHFSWKNETGAFALTVAANPCQVPQERPVALPPKVEDLAVLSPEMGIFRPNGLSDGQVVRTGDIVGFVETNALRLPATAPADGRLGEALVENGAPVGYHDILFRIHPDG